MASDPVVTNDLAVKIGGRKVSLTPSAAFTLAEQLRRAVNLWRFRWSVLSGMLLHPHLLVALAVVRICRRGSLYRPSYQG
jgi:hypothetical protein